MNPAFLTMLAVLVAVQAEAQRAAPPPAATAASNPSAFRATQLLDLRRPGVAPRIRFEWEQVAGTPEYVLTGRWTDAQSWALRSREYRVTPRSATRWDGDRVAFDVSLPEGTHSWQLVAVFGPRDDGDFARPSHVSFEIR
jgi:hypothetical protein